MPRRRQRTSPDEGFVHAAAKLPWWLCILLAVLSYLLLHAFTASSVPKPVFGPRGVSYTPLMLDAMTRGVAGVLQYLLPFLLLLAGVRSAVTAYRQQRSGEDDALDLTAVSVDGMTWHQFELLIGEVFRRKGYEVVETGGGGADGGIDLELRKPATNGSEMFLVQCKHWKAYRVSVNVIRELYGVMAARGAAGGFVVTSGRFTSEAADFARGRNVELIDGEHLVRLLSEIRPRHDAARVEPVMESPKTGQPGPSSAPACPLCAAPMVRRVAKRGPGAGDYFFGCSTYPACRGTRRV
ncbi:restriction endonuclease [Roseateles sp. So40a]|uniref:restriction endonuclease n=1 Tax=Roseateles sp. So40a TaxID=3400226 RepID=UPI003A87A3BE